MSSLLVLFVEILLPEIGEVRKIIAGGGNQAVSQGSGTVASLTKKESAGVVAYFPAFRADGGSFIFCSGGCSLEKYF
jgi:hypothetical protein